MKHLYKKMLLAAFLSGAAVTVSAANPFTDVSSSDWAYQSVSRLSQEGVVEGYPDGTFKGQQNITRYEMAQIIARLMAREDQLNSEQKAQVEQLASAYADELKQLGVRVSALENKVGNTRIIGELRVHYMDRYDDIRKSSSSKDGEYGARLRINTISEVNDKLHIVTQFQTLMGMAGKSLTGVNGEQDSQTTLNRLFAYYTPRAKVAAVLGQFPVKMGVTGYTYDGGFKGVGLQIGTQPREDGLPVDGGRFLLAYGRAVDINPNYTGAMMHGYTIHTQIPRYSNIHLYPMDNVQLPGNTDDDVPAVFASYVYSKPLKFEGHLYKLRALGPVHNIVDAYGAALSWYPWKFLNLHGEYVKNNKKLPLNNEKPMAYNYGISYGAAHPLYPKSMLIGVDYVYSEAGTYFGGSSSDVADQYMGAIYKNQNINLEIPAGTILPDGTPLPVRIPASYNGNIPAYLADKITNPGQKAGGAKFYLAKMQYVPTKGVLMELSYGFKAENMAGHKLGNIFRFQTSIYFK